MRRLYAREAVIRCPYQIEGSDLTLTEMNQVSHYIYRDEGSFIIWRAELEFAIRNAANGESGHVLIVLDYEKDADLGEDIYTDNKKVFEGGQIFTLIKNELFENTAHSFTTTDEPLKCSYRTAADALAWLGSTCGCSTGYGLKHV